MISRAAFNGFLERSLTPLVYGCGFIVIVLAGFLLSYEGWQVLWLPILLTVSGHIVFAVILFPSAFLAGVMQVTEKLFPRLARLAGVSATAYIAFIIALVTAQIVTSVSNLFDGPHALLGYGWAVLAPILPWAVFALRDRKNFLFLGVIWMLLIVNVAVLLIFGGGQAPFWPYCGAVFAGLCLMLGAQALTERASAPKEPV